MLAVGDGALGFWAALRDVWPETAEQRDWVHEVANVLDALPKSVQPTAKKMLAEIRDAEDREHAVAAAKRFDAEFRARWPKAPDKITGDLDRLVSFYDFPAEHWIHLRTSNPIESTFATVRLRTKVTKGPGSRAAGLAMAFKLIESAQDRWRALNGPHLVALVRAGAVCSRGGCSSRTRPRIRSQRDHGQARPQLLTIPRLLAQGHATTAVGSTARVLRSPAAVVLPTIDRGA